jgi:hypothetical protein
MSDRKLQRSAGMLSGKASKKNKVLRQKLEDVAAFLLHYWISLAVNARNFLYHRAQKFFLWR